MIRLLTKNALIPPGIVLLAIHQVVSTFHNITVIKVYPKNFFQLVTCSVSLNMGSQAMKIRKVRGEVGQAAQRRRPPRRASRKPEYFELIMYRKLDFKNMEKLNGSGTRLLN